MEQAARLGLMGKHPGYGDFLRAGLSEGVEDRLARWLEPALAELRDQLGEGWGPFWDQGQDLRFWIGRAVAGVTLAGILRPSRDKVGRRYPLLLLAEGIDRAPPVEDPDQAIWTLLARHLDRMQPGQGAAALLSGTEAIRLPAEDAAQLQEGTTLWAHRPDGDLEALLLSAGPVDAGRAALGRSYWWAPARPGLAAVWLGCDGLPAAPALGWLLAGVPAQDPEHVHE